LAVRFQLRGGTSTEWTNANPILLPVEIGVETDTKKIKIGNGVDTWTNLLYMTQGEIGLTGLTGLTGEQGVQGETGLTGDVSLAQLNNLAGTGRTTENVKANADNITAKVDKVTNKSLVLNTEIAKIHASGSDNQDLSGLVVKVTGKELSSNDYTTLEKTKLGTIESNAKDDMTGAEIKTALGITILSGSNTGDQTLPTLSNLGGAPIASPTFVGTVGGITKAMVGLSNVPNLSFSGINTGDQDLSGLMPKSGGTLENYTEKIVVTTGGINLSLGNVFTQTLSANTTYSITNVISEKAHSFTLIITQTSTVRTLTFPASVKWQDSTIPDLTTASKTYVLTFVTINGGTTWLGMFGGEF